MYAASERQDTAARGEVQVPRGGIYEWRKEERQEIDTRIGKANAVLRELYRSVDKKGASKHRKAVSFYIGFCSDPYLWLWLWIWGYGRKNINSGASTKDGIFAKSPRCDKGVYRG